MSGSSFIRIRGAREHNLKSINLDIPRNQLVVITGVSGSGKSSLAFDTIYAEGQRRYVESLSAYARQFLGLMEKPDVDLIDGLSPAISIEQKASHRNPRSTVGTVTEIYDYLRLLFARAGQPHCHQCRRVVHAVASDQIIDRALSLGENTRLQILAPLVQKKKGQHQDIIEKMKKEGFMRLRINNETYDLHNDEVRLEKNKKHTIEAVIDRLILKEGVRSRLTDSIELALKYGQGMICLFDGKQEHFFTQSLYCTHCDLSLPEFSPRSFSFNSPMGACSHCDGLGVHAEFDEERIVPDTNKSLSDGAIAAWGSANSVSYWHNQTLNLLAHNYEIDIHCPWKKLGSRKRKLILYGSHGVSQPRKSKDFEGIIPNLERRYRETRSDDARANMQRFMREKKCPQCQGKRLRAESLGVLYHGKNIMSLCDQTITYLSEWFNKLQVSEQEAKIVSQILREISERLSFLNNVGVGYLNLSRQTGSLSGGEAQRIRLATQIGSSLMGVLYVLDEPSIGLHQRDNQRLLNTLMRMRDIGNTVIVVEHDEDTIRSADYVVDIGPGAGVHGGKVVACGTPAEICRHPDSLTGSYLNGSTRIPIPSERRLGNGKILSVLGAAQNNLKKIDVDFPLGRFICVTGVSGSGKSTLINDILYKALAMKVNRQRFENIGKYASLKGVNYIDRVLLIDQEPIGRTPRSNPATYTGMFTPIRELFSHLPEAKLRGYAPGRFSFNVNGGRCENCEGTGILKIEMHFLPDVYVKCSVCNGRRFNSETLQVHYKGCSIYDVLEMTVERALSFFENIDAIRRKLQTLVDVGLQYIKLGQPATTLSGGEAQRVKLSTELSRRSTGSSLYILDEPSTGLHFEDISRLLKVLHSLVDRGNTVIVIEHNLDMIKTADYIIDLGPEGGSQGGQVICSGSPEEVVRVKKSYTGHFLGEMLVSRHPCKKSPP